MINRIEPRLVALRLAPGPAFGAALDRVWSDGDAVLPLAHDLPARATDDLLALLRPARLIDAQGERALSDPAPVAPGVALVVATSGSTGRPKGVELTHAALAASTRASLDRLGGRPGDTWLCCLPLSHIAGLQVLLRARALGGEAIVHPGFDPAAVAAETAATHVSLVPTQLARLLDDGVDVARFHTILLGGAPAQPGLLERAAAAGARLVCSYGMTETCGGCVYDGRPLDGVKVDVGADGVIRIRGAVLLHGYRGVGRPVDADGWFTTADLGEWGPGGLLRVRGRRDDVIVTGGENVDATAVAAALRSHPAVADAVVVGRADAEWGQRVVAVIVPAVAGAPLPEPALRQHVVERLGRAAAPKSFEAVAELPRTPLGKVAGGMLRPDRPR